MITHRSGRHKVLLPINHNHDYFRKQQIQLGQMSPVWTMSKKTSLTLEIPWFFFFFNFFLRQAVVAMVIVINTMIGGFGRKDLVRLAASTVRLQVSN